MRYSCALKVGTAQYLCKAQCRKVTLTWTQRKDEAVLAFFAYPKLKAGQMRSLFQTCVTQAWSCFAVLSVIAAPIVVNSAAARSADLESLRILAADLVNQSRAEHKLPPLQLEGKLTKAAQSHAEDMRERDYYSHYSPEGKSVGDRFQAAGGSRWVLTAENIAKCDRCTAPLSENHVRQMHEGWMNSPGHRANILREGLNSFGYGITVGASGRLYAVQTFAGPGTPQDTSSLADAKPLDEQEQIETALTRINKSRQDAGQMPLKISKTLAETALSLLPTREDGDFNVRKVPDLYGALPASHWQQWLALTLLSASCGGCGEIPVAADVEFFTRQWLGPKGYNKLLLSDDVTHLGFGMAANGEGKKVAVGLIGKHR